jgi:hypothetical protein
MEEAPCRRPALCREFAHCTHDLRGGWGIFGVAHLRIRCLSNIESRGAVLDGRSWSSITSHDWRVTLQFTTRMNYRRASQASQRGCRLPLALAPYSRPRSSASKRATTGRHPVTQETTSPISFHNTHVVRYHTSVGAGTLASRCPNITMCACCYVSQLSLVPLCRILQCRWILQSRIGRLWIVKTCSEHINPLPPTSAV